MEFLMNKFDKILTTIISGLFLMLVVVVLLAAIVKCSQWALA